MNSSKILDELILNTPANYKVLAEVLKRRCISLDDFKDACEKRADASSNLVCKFFTFTFTFTFAFTFAFTFTFTFTFYLTD